MNGLYERTELYIREHALLDLSNGFRVVAGVSGGADSVCLLLLLKQFADVFHGKVWAVHVNHCLRGKEAESDREFVRALCQKYEIELFLFEEDVKRISEDEGLTLEEAGRQVRYRCFKETSERLDAKVAVAHHLDDNAETILFHLIRGADLKGFSGMQPEITIDGMPVIRPLLFAQRQEIEEWLNERGQTFCTDASNYQTDFTRNRIRHHILEEMRKINPQAARHICRTAEMAGRAERLIEKEAERVFQAAADIETERIAMDTELLLQAEPPIADRVLYEAVVRLAGEAKDIADTHIRACMKLASGEDGKRISLPKGITAYKMEEQLVLTKQPFEEFTEEESEPVLIEIRKENLPGYRVTLPDGREMFFELFDADAEKRSTWIQKNECTKAFDYDRITGSLFIGTRMQGDYISLQNGRKSIRRFMIDQKIPQSERPKILLLKDETEVLWIIGYRIGEKYKITDDTAKVLRVTIR